MLFCSAVAVAALMAVLATSAMASLPEYYVCVKAPKLGKRASGEYTNASCSQASDEGAGAYELEPWQSAKKHTFTTKTGQTSLDEYVNGLGVVGETDCTKDKGTGTITGAKTSTEVITFEGCSNAGKACTSPQAKKGDIVTETLDGELGTISEEQPARIGVDYTGSGPGERYATFDCEGLQLELHGSVIGEVSGEIEAASKDFHVVYAVNEAGEQAITHFAGGPLQSLGVEVLGVGSLDGGWQNPDVVEAEPIIFEPRCINPYIKPTITMQPANVTVEWPSSATFTASTSCKPLLVEWQEANIGTIAGASKMFYRIARTKVDENGDEYRACFDFLYYSMCTRWATLTVVVPTCEVKPVINPEPQNVTVTEGQLARFTSGHNGIGENCQPISAQWKSEPPGANTFGTIAGAVHEYYEIPSAALAESGTRFEACFTDAGGTRCSNSALLTVNPPSCAEAPEITKALSNTTVTAPAAVTFKAEARTPSHCTVTTEWTRDGSDLGDHTDEYKISATSTSESGDVFEACFSDSVGTRCTSATLTVNAAQSCSGRPTIAKALSDVSVEEGEDATFEAAADSPSNCGTLEVTWYEAGGFARRESLSSGQSTALTIYDAAMSQDDESVEACFENDDGPTCTTAYLIVTQP